MTLEEKVPVDLEEKEADPQYAGSTLPWEDTWLPCSSPRGPKSEDHKLPPAQCGCCCLFFPKLEGPETLFFHPPGNGEPLVLSCHATPSKPKGRDTQCGANFFK